LGFWDFTTSSGRLALVDLRPALGRCRRPCIGAILGTLVSRFVLYLRREHQEAVGLDEFLTLGLIALSYGAAVQLQTYGFLAVLAAGIAMRRIRDDS
jgi:NhaP-type Na+/H+ or K+/H+ antiporter